jgi:hypothetical protein
VVDTPASVDRKSDRESESKRAGAHRNPDDTGQPEFRDQNPSAAGLGEVGADDGSVPVFTADDEDAHDEHDHRRDRSHVQDLDDVGFAADGRCPLMPGR